MTERAEVETVDLEPLPTPWNGKVGDAVEIDHPKCRGVVYRVEKINPRTVGMIDPYGAGIKADPWLIKATTKPFELRDPGEQITLGTVVTFTRTGGPVKSTTQRYVVVKHSGTTANVALLGGDGGRYIRVRNLKDLKAVPVGDL